MTSISAQAIPRQLSIFPNYPGYRIEALGSCSMLEISLDGVVQKAVLAYDIDAGTVTRYATDAKGEYRLNKRCDRIIVEQVDGTVDVKWLI